MHIPQFLSGNSVPKSKKSCSSPLAHLILVLYEISQGNKLVLIVISLLIIELIFQTTGDKLW